MKVFISWSGERSKRVAELLDEWIQCVIQAVDPWMSSKDIDRGALWFSEITDQLANTSLGIVCLTKENKNKPWILFESGALAKGLSSNRVCTFLIDLLPSDLENPLAQFNHTLPTREGVWELVRTINLSLKEMALKETILEKVFDTYWSQFDEEFQEILKTTPEVEIKEKRKENEILSDILSTVRSLEKQIRSVEVRTIDLTKMSSSKNLNEKPVFRSPEYFQIKNLIRKGFGKDEIFNSIVNEGSISEDEFGQMYERALRVVRMQTKK